MKQLGKKNHLMAFLTSILKVKMKMQEVEDVFSFVNYLLQIPSFNNTWVIFNSNIFVHSGLCKPTILPSLEFNEKSSAKQEILCFIWEKIMISLTLWDHGFTVQWNVLGPLK